MTLYEMTQATKELYEMLQQEEIDEQTVNDTIEGMEVADKLEGYCQVISQFNNDIAGIKSELERLMKKNATCTNAVERLKNNLQIYLNASGQKSVKAGTFTISTRKSKSVEIFNEDIIPQQYLIPQPAKINKRELKCSLINGTEVFGAKLVENENVQIK